ncbi:TniQ family protein [Micromonospora sp. NPDC048999]|uniref:TniQ family protein n=1 Tax=Micromonospora sp. NPDC048999 TaxID=3155391 RepID=UPI0034010B37
MTLDHPRSLPLRVRIDQGEALDSWLLRLALRNQIPAQWLLPVLGLGARLRPGNNHALVSGLPADLLRRVEHQAGLPPHALDTAVLDPYATLGWATIPGSRFCARCLHEPQCRWPIRWQLPYTFACLRHRCLLAGYCPTCRQAPHGRWSARTGLVEAHQCTIVGVRPGVQSYVQLTLQRCTPFVRRLRVVGGEAARVVIGPAWGGWRWGRWMSSGGWMCVGSGRCTRLVRVSRRSLVRRA